MAVKSYSILVDDYEWNDFVALLCIFFSPAMMLFALSLVIKDIDYSNLTKYLKFNKKIPIIDGYKWWDLVKYWSRDWIFIIKRYDGKYWVLLKWETLVSYLNEDEISPIIDWEMEEELKLFREAQELERKGKEFIAQAEKVRKQQAKVKNILN